MTRKKVLIVEDDADVRLGLDLMLRREYETVSAEDGISAVAAARRERPDVIVLDLGLPCGDGLGVLERLGGITQLASIPVIVVSGRDGDEPENDAMSRGARAFFRKPADPQQLMQKIEEAL